jgi:hypothetical protein
MQTNCFLVAKETSPPRSFFIVQRTQEIIKLKPTCVDNIFLVKKTPKPFIVQRTQEIATLKPICTRNIVLVKKTNPAQLTSHVTEYYSIIECCTQSSRIQRNFTWSRNSNRDWDDKCEKNAHAHDKNARAAIARAGRRHGCTKTSCARQPCTTPQAHTWEMGTSVATFSTVGSIHPGTY